MYMTFSTRECLIIIINTFHLSYPTKMKNQMLIIMMLAGGKNQYERKRSSDLVSLRNLLSTDYGPLPTNGPNENPSEPLLSREVSTLAMWYVIIITVNKIT